MLQEQIGHEDDSFQSISLPLPKTTTSSFSSCWTQNVCTQDDRQSTWTIQASKWMMLKCTLHSYLYTSYTNTNSTFITTDEIKQTIQRTDMKLPKQITQIALFEPYLDIWTITPVERWKTYSWEKCHRQEQKVSVCFKGTRSYVVWSDHI